MDTAVITRRMLAMKVLAGAPRCQQEYLVPVTRITFLDDGGATEAHTGRCVQRKCNQILSPVLDAVPPKGIDPWMTLFRCPACGAEEWINRGVLPLACGGLR